jgi:hypothetical protein
MPGEYRLTVNVPLRRLTMKTQFVPVTVIDSNLDLGPIRTPIQ